MASSANIPNTPPEHCPGTQSETAGKASACEGCPNQQICSSGIVKGPDPGIELVKNRLQDVKNKILILSGKGGVGKSTVTALLSRALTVFNSEWNPGSDEQFNDRLKDVADRINRLGLNSHSGLSCLRSGIKKICIGPSHMGLLLDDGRVAVLDVDICGPSQPRVMGVQDEQVHQSGSGWSPVYVDDNLSVMSIGFLLSSVDDAIIWRGPKKNGMIRQFLSEVDWGKLDYLMIDTPPGTSDEHLSLSTYLSEANLTGAIIVTTPQEVALLDVRKEIDFCKKVNINILGVIENMSLFVCPCCQTMSEIFPATTGGAVAMCAEMDVPFLGSLPLDPVIARCCDEGRNFVTELPDAAATKCLINIVKNIIQTCDKEHSI